VLAGLFVVAFGGWSTLGCAEDEASETATLPSTGRGDDTSLLDHTLQERQVRNALRRETLSRMRWEYGLDVKLTEAMGRSAFDVAGPTFIAGAQWSYQYKTKTYLGLALSGFPQSQPAHNVEPTTNFSGYYAGVRLGQTLYEAGKYRAVVFVEGGRGMAYFRVRGVGAEATNDKMTVIEPGAFFIFWSGSSLEVGATASMRLVQFDDDLQVGDHKLSSSDFSAPAFGITFRTEHH
jgi:hypothetical protein